jgi:uncharacterized lipoprotein YmbA
VDTVVIPMVAARPQMVRSVSAHVRRFEEFVRWAEPLEANLTGVLAANLAALLAPDVRVTESSLPLPLADVRLAVTVRRLEIDAAGQCRLEAACVLHSSDGSRLLPLGREVFEAPALGSDPEARVAALSACVLQLSEAIAGALRAHQRP